MLLGGKRVISNINLNDIPSGNVYVKLNNSFIERILQVIKKSNTILPDDVYSQLYRIKRGKKVSLSFVKYFSLNMEIPMEEFQENIDLITSAKFTDVGIKKPEFPMNFATQDGARFIAGIMGDGELNKQLNVRYNNQDDSLIELMLKSAKKIFGDVSYKIYLRQDKTYQLHFPKIIGIIVLLLGIKAGYKSKTNYGIPNFIFHLDKKAQATFIRQFYNDEGNVRLKDRRIQVKQTNLISVSKEEAKRKPLKYCHRALSDLQKLLSNFGIESKISLGAHRVDRADWELSTYRIENLKKFQNDVDFDVEYKKEQLDKAIKSYKFPSAARNGKINFAIECCRKTQKKYGLITKYALAKISERSLKTATYYLVELKKKGLVIHINNQRKKGVSSVYKYKIKI